MSDQIPNGECLGCGGDRIKVTPSGRRYCIPCRREHERRRKAERAGVRCSCGTDATSLNPAEVVVHRTEGPCLIAPAATNPEEFQ